MFYTIFSYSFLPILKFLFPRRPNFLEKGRVSLDHPKVIYTTIYQFSLERSPSTETVPETPGAGEITETFAGGAGSDSGSILELASEDSDSEPEGSNIARQLFADDQSVDENNN